jgi:tRNA (adenine57-N1/adenine58-N1)-methyltransferase
LDVMEDTDKKKVQAITRVMITAEGHRFFYREGAGDLHTKFGFVRKDEIEKAVPGDCLKTNTGKELFVLEPCFIDVYSKINRGAQIIPLKDVGHIIAETGINHKSRVVDAGAGSGGLACILANIVKEVTTYDIRDDFIAIVQKNKELLNLKALKIKKGNIYEGVKERDADLVTLDLPEPWLAVKPAEDIIKVGGFLMSYSPSVPQVMDFVAAVKKSGKLIFLKTIEVSEREWDVDERKVRPCSQTIGHSGFMTFARKIRN